MADTKITGLTNFDSSNTPYWPPAPASDVIPIVDISDATMAASGTTKKISINNLLSSSPTATGALTVTGLVTAGSATITGDLTVDTSTLKVVAASDVVGINTASPLTGNDAGLTIGAIGTVKALNIGLQNTFARLREKDAVDGFAISTNITGANVQDDATKSSWKVRMGFANGNDNYVISRSNVGSTTFQDIYSLSTTSAVWSDGAGGTQMTLNSTGLGVGGIVTGTGPTILVEGTAGTYAKFNSKVGAKTWSAGYRSGTTQFEIQEDGTERFVIANGGNVGIGVTPSAWAASGKAIDIGAYGVSIANTAGYQATFGNNCFYDGVWKYKASSYQAALYTQNSGNHIWSVKAAGTINTAINFTDAMTLTAAGDLLVGKNASSLITVGFQSTAAGETSAAMAASVDGTTQWTTYSTGAAAFRFYVGMGGTVFATNTVISAISDARYKENIQDIDVGLAAILSLKPRKFDWKAGKGKDIKGDRGFIAQEFETVFPNLIDEWKDTAPEGEAPYKSVRQDLIPVLVKAIQELTTRVQTLETR